MDTTELTSALREATDDLQPRPGFTTAVLRGGHRRKVRGRVIIATGTAAVTALAGTSGYLLLSDAPHQVQPADPRLTQPTKGDLAGDREFLNAASTAWRQGLRPEYGPDLRGQPHVYWAGNTPAGRAAVVLQQIFQAGELAPGDTDPMALLIGLVATDPADGTAKLVLETGESYPGVGPAAGFQFGPGDRTILVVDPGKPVWFSTAAGTSPDGRPTRDWQQAPLTEGVAIIQLPADAQPMDARVLVRAARPAPNNENSDGMVFLDPASERLAHAKAGSPTYRPALPRTEPQLKWSVDTAPLQLRAGDTSWPIPQTDGKLMLPFLEGLQKNGIVDVGSHSYGPGTWYVVAGLPDGRIAILSEFLEDLKPSRIYAVLLNRDGTPVGAVPGGQTDSSAPLPVQVRMPDGQGWVVAGYGATLRYRVAADGQWQDAGQNAALLPDNATQVQVTRGGTATEVTLPR